MTMVPRDPISEKQIADAKVSPGPKADDDEDSRQPDSELVRGAETSVIGIPLAPARLPGFKK